ncbi:hypothetical protein RJ641_002576 [Dillenia turbinata]|uniref:Uncharacterized protein n=1 Tax=Dillenia turbinata TaxID=194707 RepID=A0AAN8ZEH2_9MAGN
MKIKNKGKVYPSPSSSSSSTAASNGDSLSVLKMLPAAILTLASILSLEDREVLAYMITRSMKTTTSLSSTLEDKKKSKNIKTTNTNHKSPAFDCDCFDCYTSYWVRWDSSENRELIHHVIEAFEDHLNNGDQHTKKSNGGRGKKREKMNRRVNDKSTTSEERETPLTESSGNAGISPAKKEETEAEQVKTEIFEVFEQSDGVSGTDSTELMDIVRSSAANNHKGLARKVLPDVLGLLNSRLWNLWSPNA